VLDPRIRRPGGAGAPSTGITSRPRREGGFVNQTTDDWNLVDGIPYTRSLRSYPDGWATTHDLSVNFASRTASVVSEAMGAQGVFQLRAHSAEIDSRTRSLGGSFTAVIRPDASTGQLQVAQTYGRYTRPIPDHRRIPVGQ
jgi:hypothetical protein